MHAVPSFVLHRVNRLAQLDAMDPSWGAEIDLRSDVQRPSNIHLSHDPWQLGEPLEPWLRAWAQRPRGPLILNTKEDGLEETLRQRLHAHGIARYFFLDTALPTLVRCSRAGWGAHLALRLSAFEAPGALAPWRALPAGQRPAYLWVDCFDARPVPLAWLTELKNDFALCLVSPALQGDLGLQKQSSFVPLARVCALLCCKQPAVWASALA